MDNGAAPWPGVGRVASWVMAQWPNGQWQRMAATSPVDPSLPCIRQTSTDSSIIILTALFRVVALGADGACGVLA
jgi:hypothetical protein